MLSIGVEQFYGNEQWEFDGDGVMRRRPEAKNQRPADRPEHVRAAIQTCVSPAYESGFAPLEAFLPTPE